MSISTVLIVLAVLMLLFGSRGRYSRRRRG
jgi:Sec-independent protein translocase protein TatA